MSSSGAEYLRHILDEVEYLVEHSRGVTREDFLKDETLRRAFARSLEIIGEAAKKVPPDVAEQLRDIEWRAMAGMRDRLIHGYFGVDYDLVWTSSSTKYRSWERGSATSWKTPTPARRGPPHRGPRHQPPPPSGRPTPARRCP